jgi:hypothetical protein
MGTKSKWEYFRAIYQRYRKASLSVKTQILEEFCHVCGYNRKYAIAKLNGPAPQFKPPAKRQRRSPTYTAQALVILQALWEASGYPWSVRLKALLPLWLPWVKKRYSLTPKIEHQLLSISARQIDRRLKGRKTPTAPLRPHQARHAAQTPYPHQNRFLECQNPRIYRNRSGLALRQLRKGRVYLFPQRHRYLLHVGRKPCRHG